MVHGDDFVSEGPVASLTLVDFALKKVFELKTGVMGAGPELVTEMRLLSMVIRWTPRE